MCVSLLHRRWVSGLALLGLAESRVEASDLDVLLFASLDAGRSTFSASGAKIGLGTLDRNGPLALVAIGDGVRIERKRCGCGAPATILSLSAQASAQLGYQWVLPQGVVAAFAGYETRFDGVRGVRDGMRLQAEAWLRPDENTLVHAVTVAGTARGSVWTRIAWGYRLWDAYLGPEGSAYLDATGYGKVALGLHATDFVLKNTHIRLSTGMQWESHRSRPAPYFTLTTWASF